MAQALLLIDLQNDYFPGGKYPLAGIEAASRKASELLDVFRNEQRPIVHVRHVFESPQAPFFQPDTAGVEIHSSVAPLEGEKIVTKHYVNSFRHTDLQDILAHFGADSLLICGAMSHMCVEGTTRAAADLDYRCQVVHDACATCDQTFGSHKISAADVHGTAMAALGFAYAEVLSAAEWRKAHE